MLKSLLSLVTPNNKEKKKQTGAGPSPASSSHQADVSFSSDADVSNLNDTSVTIPMGDGCGDTSIISSSRPLGDEKLNRKNRAVSFDFCLSDEKLAKDVVVRRRSLQPATPSPSPSDADHSFLESIFDSPVQRNRLHSVIGDKIYEASTPPPSPNSDI